MGRFLNKDTWGGNYYKPLSFNQWNYVDGNPTNYIDPNGQSPNCPKEILGGDWCARQRLFEIVNAETANNGVLALARSFEDKELMNYWGDYAGKTSGSRLEWILKVTQGSDNPNSPQGILAHTLHLPVYFALYWGSDCGFSSELQDSHLYPEWGLLPSASNQVGHFLSAVGITYYHWNIAAIVGHEQTTDSSPLNYVSYITVSDEDMNHWYAAVKYDEQGSGEKRDDELWPILHFDDSIKPGNVVSKRQGNSLQDLRLSIKGYRFALWVENNRSTLPVVAGAWLRAELMP
jgi:hypothetical protein